MLYICLSLQMVQFSCLCYSQVLFSFKQELNPAAVLSRVLHFSQPKPKHHCCFNSQNREFAVSQVKSTRKKKIFLIFQCSNRSCKTAWYCTLQLLEKIQAANLIQNSHEVWQLADSRTDWQQPFYLLFLFLPHHLVIEFTFMFQPLGVSALAYSKSFNIYI